MVSDKHPEAYTNVFKIFKSKGLDVAKKYYVSYYDKSIKDVTNVNTPAPKTMSIGSDDRKEIRKIANNFVGSLPDMFDVEIDKHVKQGLMDKSKKPMDFYRLLPKYVQNIGTDKLALVYKYKSYFNMYCSSLVKDKFPDNGAMLESLDRIDIIRNS